MNPAYIHLLMNHIPVFGTLFGLAFLIYAALRRNETLFRASLSVFLVVGVLTIPVYLTGEPAEDVVEHFPGLTISKAAVEEHEDAALAAFIAIGAVALLAIALLVVYRRAAATPRGAVVAAVAVALLAFGLVAWTAKLGGEIHHPEIAGVSSDKAGGGNDDDDD